MCTVTFIPGKASIYFTSNRDETNLRSPANAPATRTMSSGRVVYPRDANAGGTWIAAHENGNVVIFLNGAFVPHVPAPPYRKSRGLILLDLVDHSTPFNGFLAVNLNNIEPFTAIIRDNGHLFECRWNGYQKYYEELNAAAPHIWASATLYNEEMIRKRKAWFNEFVSADPHPSQNEVLDFHQYAGDGDGENDLVMNRHGKVYTRSITSIAISGEALKMVHLDLQNKQLFEESLSFDPSMAVR